MTVNTDNFKSSLALCMVFMFWTTCAWSAEIVSSDFDPLTMLDAGASEQMHEPNNVTHPAVDRIEPALALYTPDRPPVDPADALPNAMTWSHEAAAAPLKTNNDMIISENPGTLLQQQLWRARISTAAETDNDLSKNELDRLIEQISVIEIKAQPQPPLSRSESRPVAEPLMMADPNDTVSDTDCPKQPDLPETQPLPDNVISAETLNQLIVLSQMPEKLKNPMQMAEILYSSGCLTEAAGCYEAALVRMSGRENEPSQEKAWILFQLGNCLKEKDPQAAQEKYQTLIADFPHSPWAPLAKAKSDATAWFLREQPVKLLEASRERTSELKRRDSL